MNHSSPIGNNQLELLLFTLGDSQVYGINVFKTREIMELPEVNEVPKSDPRIVGIVDYRDVPTTIIDLNRSLDKKNTIDESEGTHVVYTSFNSRSQGFLVDKVVRIVRLDWQEVHPPPLADASECYLTGVTKIDGKLIEIIDVEKILEDVTGGSIEGRLSARPAPVLKDVGSRAKVMIVDDSAMARNKTRQIIESLGIQVETCNNGYEALQTLKQIAKEASLRGNRIEDEILLCITDIEMPQLDGLAFLDQVRSDQDLKNLHIIIQSSIERGFRNSGSGSGMANGDIVKWDETKLIEQVEKRISEL
tara:strand:+ start:109821 stop:110738 length:918 start_codon:yes stop_codon:yes gene_type:complete